MLETKRLVIIPLTFDQLVKYITNDNSLEHDLGLNDSCREISPDLKDALESTIMPNVANHDKDILYSTLWTMILKEEKKMVGDLCFVGEPNAEGEIEIGYGTYESYRNKGLMTEAVGAMIDWAKTQTNVKTMLASTEKENTASYSVLIKNHFTRLSESESLINWGLILK
ncbi:MAG TPA: GNAT family N-acetyltransferase [Saprospiraceae bacterium]|nr:GNAT family N-acetyltransferase [Saprospiraceae bacterium]